MRRKIAIAALLLSAGVLGMCVCSSLLTSAVTYARFQHSVKQGMSLQQIETVLGAGQLEVGSPGFPGGEKAVQGDAIYRWYAHGIEMYVGFTEGQLVDKVVWYIDYP